MNQAEIYDLLVKQGATPTEARTLAAIAMAESGGNPAAANVSDIERSFGLFQINTNVHGLSPDQAMNPATSAQYALKLAREQGYKPWSVYTNGAYQKFLGGGGQVPENTPVEYDPFSGTVQNTITDAGGWNIKPIQGPTGVIGYMLVDEYGRPMSDMLTPEQVSNLEKYGSIEGLDKAPQDSAADTMNAYTSRMNALSQRLAGLASFYDTMVATGKLTADDAWQRYTAEVGQIQAEQDTLWKNAQLAVEQGGQDISRGRLALDTATSEEDARRTREITEAQRRLGVAEEAGRRAKTVATDILPFSVPNATSISLPLLGTMPLAQINTDTFFNQGGPGNLGTLPAISPDPSVPFPQPPAPVQLPTLPMPAQPTMPAPYQPPSFEDTTKMALALLGGGFGGF